MACSCNTIPFSSYGRREKPSLPEEAATKANMVKLESRSIPVNTVCTYSANHVHVPIGYVEEGRRGTYSKAGWPQKRIYYTMDTVNFISALKTVTYICFGTLSIFLSMKTNGSEEDITPFSHLGAKDSKKLAKFIAARIDRHFSFIKAPSIDQNFEKNPIYNQCLI